MGNYDFSLDLSTENTMSVIDSWLTDGSMVLEFGPANGRLTQHMALNRGCSVVIVERDYEAGKEAAKYAVRSYLGEEEGDIDRLKWENIDIAFDYIIFADVLEHLSEPEKILRRASALLKDNGRILISVPNISHNSIMIGLLNDQFTYSSTGLLDSTHIHFFAYENLKEMIRNAGLYITELHQIYSRVGHNEIAQAYSDISGEIGKVLRQRINGSTYQFVLNLSKSESDQCNPDSCLRLLEEDVKEELESLFFYSFEEEGEFTDELVKGTIYKERENIEITLNVEDIGRIKRLRWNPLPFDGVINILRADLKAADEQVFPLIIKDCNADRFFGNMIIFYDNPWIEYKIPSDLNIKQITIEFYVFAYREKNTEYYKQLDYLLNTVSDDIAKASDNQNKVVFCDECVAKYKEHIAKLEEYVNHLEKDIKLLKQKISTQRNESRIGRICKLLRK